MPPRPRNPRAKQYAEDKAKFKNLRTDNSVQLWAAYPKITDVYKNPTEIQRRQHRIQAHKYKIKHLEAKREELLSVQKSIMKKVAKHGRGDPAALKATLNKLRREESNLESQWVRLHGNPFTMNYSKPRDPLEKRIAAAHRKFRQAEDKLLAATYKPGHRHYDARVKALAKVDQAIAKEKAALATNSAKLNRARPAARR